MKLRKILLAIGIAALSMTAYSQYVPTHARVDEVKRGKFLLPGELADDWTQVWDKINDNTIMLDTMLYSVQYDARFNSIVFTPQSTEPTLEEGEVYYKDAGNLLLLYNGIDYDTLNVGGGGGGAADDSTWVSITTNTISEYTVANGITIDGVSLKDGDVTLGATGRLYYGGGTSTYSYKTAGDEIRVIIGGVELERYVENGINSYITAWYDLNVADDLAVDNITEYTGAAGVTVDGLLIKDGVIGYIDDSLALHLDTLQAHNIRINTNLDSITAHNTRINTNLDSLTTHNTRLIALEGAGYTSDHGSLTGLTGDDHLQYYNTSRLTSWAGSSNITTLGTITTGTWNGTIIANGYIPAALTSKSVNGVTLSTGGIASDYLDETGSYSYPFPDTASNNNKILKYTGVSGVHWATEAAGGGGGGDTTHVHTDSISEYTGGHNIRFFDPIMADTIIEATTDNGVIIEGVHFENSQIQGVGNIYFDVAGGDGLGSTTGNSFLMTNSTVRIAAVDTAIITGEPIYPSVSGLDLGDVVNNDRFGRLFIDTIIINENNNKIYLDPSDNMTFIDDNGGPYTLEQLSGSTASISVNTINEYTATSGVTTDGVLLKDGNVTLPATSRLYLDGATSNYIYQPAGGTTRFINNSAAVFDVTTISLDPYISVIPKTNHSIDLGSGSYFWQQVYLDTVYLYDDNTKLYRDGSNNLTLSDNVSGAVTLAALLSGSTLDSTWVTVTADTLFLESTESESIYQTSTPTVVVEVNSATSATFGAGSATGGDVLIGDVLGFNLGSTEQITISSGDMTFEDGNAGTATLTQLVQGSLGDTIPVDTVAHMLVDTMWFAGNIGLNNPGDTVSMLSTAQFEWPTVQDSVVFDSVYAYCYGTSGDVGVRAYEKDDPTDGSRTYLHTEVNPTTGTPAGTSTFTQVASGPGKILGFALTTVTTKPTQVVCILYYHEKRAY